MGKQRVKATICNEAGEVELAVLEGTMGPEALDIQQLYPDHGLLAFDPGFRSTASCKSAITFIDGETGVLLYRGYPIEELAEKATLSRSLTC